MLEEIWSGAQTGADRAGLDAALILGLRPSGWMPKYWLAEDGPHPEFKAKYNMKETMTKQYRDRTTYNVAQTDGVVLFGKFNSPGSKLTLELCEKYRKPIYLVPFPPPSPTERDLLCNGLRPWITHNKIRKLNVAGNRASKNFGIYDFVLKFLFDALGEQNAKTK